MGRRRTVISLLLLAALAIVFHWAVVSWVAFAKVSPPVDSSGGLDRLGALLRSSGRLQVLYLPVSFVLAMLNFLPYVVLAGLITVLQAAGRSDAGLFVLRTRWAWRLLAVSFAGFVIGLGGTVPFLEGRIGLPVAFALGLLGMRYLPRRNVDAAVTKIEMLNQVPSASSALLSARREILERAMTVLLMKRTQRELFSEYMSRKLPGHTYYARHARLEREWRQVAEEGENEEPDKFRLPTGWPPGKMALSLGPADTWWQNGMTAVKVGAKLAVVPIAYYLYVLLTKQLPDFFTTRGGWPYLSAAASLLGEVSFWLVAALVLGCLYPYLPGRNGVLKSLSMTGLYVATLTIGTWLLGGEPGWIFRSLQLLLFLAALGLSLDWMTITRAGLYWEHLIEYYRLRDARVLAGSASSLLLALLAIGQQLLSGDAQQAVTELIRSFTSLIPQVPMGGG